MSMRRRRGSSTTPVWTPSSRPATALSSCTVRRHGRSYQVDVTGPATATLLYRVAASTDRDMRYWDPYDAHSHNVSPSLLWRRDPRVSVSLKYERYRKVETPQLMH